MNQQLKDHEIREKVREAYAAIAKQAGDAAGKQTASCCSSGHSSTCCPAETGSGYTNEDLSAAPEGSNMGLGCGNPQAIAALKAGEIVLDLGSGGGFDCFLAAKQVGGEGRVIGVDMTPEMIAKARRLASEAGYTNVEFRLGEIENLPVADGSVDAVLSNCVINLSPNKPRVYREAYRALRPGGRLAISDVVATAELPDELRNDLALYARCIAGAATIPVLERILREIGFERISIRPNSNTSRIIREWLPGTNAEDYVVSASIEAVKPQ